MMATFEDDVTKALIPFIDSHIPRTTLPTAITAPWPTAYPWE